MSTPAANLLQLGESAWAWLSDNPAPGAANAGIVVDEDGLTIIDALATPAAARPLLQAAEAMHLPVRRLVMTSSHAPHVGGSGVFALPAVYGTPQISAHLDQPADPTTYAAMFPDQAEEFVEIAEVPTRPVTHMVSEGVWLSPSVVVAPLSGELAENLVVQIPEERIVFAGALATFGVTPMAGGGDPAAWADALDVLLQWGEIIVPGHGMLGGEEEVRTLQGYLRACCAAEGDAARVAPGPWDEWPGRHYDAVNVERAARLAADDPTPPSALLKLLGLD